MKDEIKEILDNLKYTAKKHTIQVLENGEKIEHCPQEIETELRLNTYSANILLDYITNLQTIEQQYSAILSENAELKNKISDLQKDLDYQRQAEQEYNEKHTKLMNKYKKLQEENERVSNLYQTYEEANGLWIKKYEDYKSRIDKANEYIEENTRWFDSEYAKIYGELCDCAGANSNRLEVLVNPSNLSKILGGDKDVKD